MHMSKFTCFKKTLLLSIPASIFFLILDDCAIANQAKNAKIGYTPPPIPAINSSDFKEFVGKNHTFPSPYGYEPYRDRNGNEITFPLSELNTVNPYIPVTFYCNSQTRCPDAVAYSAYADEIVSFHYPNDQDNLRFGIKSADYRIRSMIGFYYPDDPTLYVSNVGDHIFKNKIKKGDPLITILFSQRSLQALGPSENGYLRGYFYANNTVFDFPLATGKEFVTVGTTLGILGLGEASGVEFSEMVSQTTGETSTTQVQTGFSLNLSFETQATVGGGVAPASDSIKFGVNTTLSTLISNGLAISNQNTVSRTYTIKPGINDTYYWAIYQLLYSYRIDAPLLEKILKMTQSIWHDDISFKIADNQATQDGKRIGNLLPPQASNIVSDITVGVAVPIYPNSKGNVFSQKMTTGR